jgi:hypothetical protein
MESRRVVWVTAPPELLFWWYLWWVFPRRGWFW